MDTISKGDYRMLCWLRDQSQDVKLEHLDGDDRDRMERLIRQKLVSTRRDTHRIPSGYGVRIGVTTTCTLASTGQDALAQFEQNLDQQAKDETDKKRSIRRGWLQLIFGSLLSFVLGMIAEHFGNIVTLISSLFRGL